MRTAASLAVWLTLSLVLPGCYLSHVARGQARLLWSREPIESVIADPATVQDVRRRLEQVRQVRRFAAGLGLAVDDQFTSYVPWPGDRIVTTVVATRPGEVTPAGFWFPIVGRVPYKGYFDAERAHAEAERLRADGMDVCEVAVSAYSTLGWFDDPVTGPMLRLPEGQLTETLLHELVHATVFARDQADFNEGVAAFFGEEAGVLYAATHVGDAAGGLERRRVESRRRLRAELGRTRREIEALYAASEPGPERDAARARIEVDARARIGELSLEPDAAGAIAERVRLNDACLALAGVYFADAPRYVARLEAEGGDLVRFLRRAREAADAADPTAALLGGEAGP